MYKINKKQNVIEKNKIICILKAVLSGYVYTIVFLFLLTFLLYQFDISNSQINVGIIVILIMASLLTGYITGKKINKNSWMWGCVSGGCYFVIFFIIALILNNHIPAGKELMTVLPICLGSSTLGGMIS